jgi:hypothetical protein
LTDVSSKLTILFEDPFWVGIYERVWDGKYEVCKITFGAEPKDRQLYEFMLTNWHRLKFGPPVGTERFDEKRINPKRMQRNIEKQLHQTGVGTKAQQALQRQREQNKQERHTRSREQREEEKERRFELRQDKQKKKHRGH